MSVSQVSRRSFLAGAAATAATPLVAGAPMLGVPPSNFRRFQLGSFEVTTILAGQNVIPNPQNIFGMNASAEDFAAASAEALIPADQFQIVFTPTIVNTGSELILFDTGLNAAATTAALAGAGYSPDQVDKVVLTHLHPDHIGGLMSGDTPTYANATPITGAVEFDEWDLSGDETFEAQVRPIEDQLTLVDPDAAIASGITAVEAFGHTPGHMAYMLESDGKQLLLGGDFTNHYVWSLAHPDWEVLFDRDKEAAAKTRRKLLDMLATDKIPMIGYHMPFPGLGFVETRGDGFHYVPHSYQMAL